MSEFKKILSKFHPFTEAQTGYFIKYQSECSVCVFNKFFILKQAIYVSIKSIRMQSTCLKVFGFWFFFFVHGSHFY